MSIKRFITVTDGTGMGDALLIFKTNAPVEVLKELERISCDVYVNGGNYEDVPIWVDVLTEKGYLFEYVEQQQHITPYKTSENWLEDNYSFITEHYVIENQP